MTNRRATLIFIFLFIIPYISAQIMIGIAYNALVLHSDSLWRSLVGAFVGAWILYFAKIPLEHPLRVLGKYTTIQLIHYVVRFFMLEHAKWWKQVLNFTIDFLVAVGATYVLRWLFPVAANGSNVLMGTPLGWMIAILFISLCIGAYIDFDALSVIPNTDNIEND